MKTYPKLWKLIPLVVLFFTSCTEFLTIDPDNRTEVEGYYNSAQRIDQAVVGAYVDLRRALLNNYAWLMYGEARATDLSINVTYQSFVATQRLNTNEYDLVQLTDWAYFYDVIKSANSVIDILDGLEPGVLSAYQHNLYRGEALALKSMSYFYLARIWGDVPSGERADLGQKITSSTAVTRAISFAGEAIDLLPWTLLNDDGIESTALTAIRFNKTAVSLLLAQEALWNNEAPLALNTLQALFADEAQLSGFGLSMGIDRRTEIPATPLNGSVVSMPLDKLNSIYPEGDQRRTNLFTISESQAKATLIVKDQSKLDLIKLSELHLLLSEASWRSGNMEDARQYLSMAAQGATEDYTNVSDEAFADALLLERQRLLVGTGQRFFDLMRFGKVSLYIPSLSENAVQNGAAFWPLSERSIHDNAFTQNAHWSNQPSN